MSKDFSRPSNSDQSLSTTASTTPGKLTDGPIVFFDGVCGLCNTAVDWFLQHDRRGKLLYSPLQGKAAQSLLTEGDRKDLNTLVFVKDGQIYRRSLAVALLLKEIGGVSKLYGTIILMAPEPIRDLAYTMVARTRYFLFGRKDTCRIPSPSERARFLD